MMPDMIYNNKMTDEDTLPLDQKLNLETGKITWPELQRHFARGVVIEVSAELDLIEIAQSVAQDSADSISRLIDDGRLIRATDDHARRWQETQPLFWAVVVAPWVLVQEIKA